MSSYSFLTSNTAPTCRDFAESNFFPSWEFRSIEPNSGPKIRLLFVLESSLPFSSSFSESKKKKKNKRKRITKLLYKPYTKFVFERIKRVLELRGVDLGYRRSRNYLPFPEDLPLQLTLNHKNQWYDANVLLKRFHLMNGNTIGFRP